MPFLNRTMILLGEQPGCVIVGEKGREGKGEEQGSSCTWRATRVCESGGYGGRGRVERFLIVPPFLHIQHERAPLRRLAPFTSQVQCLNPSS